MSLSIVIPVFREEKNIAKVLEQTDKRVKTKHEKIIVYDLEEDPTLPVVKDYLKKNKNSNVRLVNNFVGGGRGVLNAILSGIKKAKGEAVVVVMADLSDDISQIDDMYALMVAGYDIVCASRYMPSGKKYGGPLVKSILSRLAGLSLKYLIHLPTHDATNAYKMYKRNIFNNIKIESKEGFTYSLEIILKAFKKGYKITEIPTVWRDREEGKSNFQILKWLPEYIKWYIFAFKRLD